MPFSPDDATLVLLSVPWDVTSSFGAGSAAAPAAIIEASTQLDFFDPWAPGAWRRGIATLPFDDPAQSARLSSASSHPASFPVSPSSIRACSEELRPEAEAIIKALEGRDADCEEKDLAARLSAINLASTALNAEIHKTASDWLARGKIVGLLGGDHSTPLGLIKAVAETHNNVSILHLDAHCDLRPAYEGFTHSHASIMYNVLSDVPNVEKLVQVGIRDFSEAEKNFADGHSKIVQFTGRQLSENQFNGTNWATQCETIVKTLQQNVYVSFDIDFLSPDLCPGTGTPVPGGRSFDEAIYLIRSIVDSGRHIVGFDLCEVSPQTTIDASVGARILFALCGQTLRKNS